MKRLAFALCAAAVAAVTTPGGALLAQRPADFPVIVVFHDDAPLDAFAAGYRPDDRAAADPQGWGYLNRGVAGAVRSLEARESFRAEHVFSAALRGFSARLNARQIAALEDDPNVAFIEPDGEMFAIAQTIPWGIDKIGWQGRPRPYDPIEEIDLTAFDFEAYVAKREADAASAGG